MEETLRRQLDAIVGNTGLGSGSVVLPANITQLREVLATCAGAGVPVAPEGSARASDADVVISTDHLNSVLLDPDGLLLHAGAGAPWTVVREAAVAGRLAVSGLPSVRSERVGESVALGEIAHRTLAGVHLLTVAGALISAGGRTLKDVVGYDLPGLALGSGARLGLILAVALRLEPAGARTAAEPGLGPWRGEAGIDVGAAFTG
ncbi:MAG TPA: FAD-binding protein [Candidatus Dormibacteraeota bacterium]|nr:FAD-binding protein [Candidatus Dormibacteraeota bacterium]